MLPLQTVKFKLIIDTLILAENLNTFLGHANVHGFSCMHIYSCLKMYATICVCILHPKYIQTNKHATYIHTCLLFPKTISK